MQTGLGLYWESTRQVQAQLDAQLKHLWKMSSMVHMTQESTKGEQAGERYEAQTRNVTDTVIEMFTSSRGFKTIEKVNSLDVIG